MFRTFVKLLVVSFVLVVTAAPAWADAILLSDAFDGTSINSSTWLPIYQGQQSIGLGDGATINATEGGGVLTVAGSTQNSYWSGCGLLSVQNFSLSQQHTLSVTSVSASVQAGSDTDSDPQRSADIWFYVDSDHYLALRRSSEDLLDFEGRMNDVVNNNYVEYTSQNSLIDNDDGGAHALKLVYTPLAVAGNGNLDMYWDNTLVASQELDGLPGTTFKMAVIGEGRYGGDEINATFANALVTTVPEPSVLALLTCGLAGLLCYAWRKRR